jgi:hypothetical protein
MAEGLGRKGANLTSTSWAAHTTLGRFELGIEARCSKEADGDPLLPWEGRCPLCWAFALLGSSLVFVGLMGGVWGLFHNYVEAATYHPWEAELHLRARDGDGEAGEKVVRQRAGQEIYPGPKGANSVDWPWVVLGFAMFALGGSMLVRAIVVSGWPVQFGGGGDVPGGDAPQAGRVEGPPPPTGIRK